MKRKVWVAMARILRCIACMLGGICPRDKGKKKPPKEENEEVS